MSETLKIVVPWFDSKCTECVARGCVQVPTIYLPVNHPLNQKQVSTNDPDLTVTPPVVDRCTSMIGSDKRNLHLILVVIITIRVGGKASIGKEETMMRSEICAASATWVQ